jgi:hypothetical protein
MSLDVYLKAAKRCPHCAGELDGEEIVFEANITHNLNSMAEAARIYMYVWRPEKIGITHASQLIEPLRTAIVMMEADPAKFKQYDAMNRWGTYEDFIPWLKSYLAACEEHPDAAVSVSR